MAQAVSRWPLTAEARVQPPDQSMWDLWWTKWHWGRFFSEFFGFPPPISFHHWLHHIHISPPHEVCDSSDQAAHYHHLSPKLGASFLTRQFGLKQNKNVIILSWILSAEFRNPLTIVMNIKSAHNPMSWTLHDYKSWPIYLTAVSKTEYRASDD
jgi:hypothetical protein